MRKIEMYNDKSIYLYDKGEFISDQVCNSKLYFEEDTLRLIAGKYNVSYVVDIGANLGNHSHFFSNNCGSKVFCFEPSSTNYQLLKLNCPEQILFKVALGDKVGIANLITYESCKGNNTIAELWGASPDWGSGVKKEEVVIAKLDDFSFPSVTFVKIDVEGSELRVLKGAFDTLLRHHPVVAIEMHTDEVLLAGNFEYRRSDIVNIMRQLGYTLDFEDVYGNHFFNPGVTTF